MPTPTASKGPAPPWLRSRRPWPPRASIFPGGAVHEEKLAMVVDVSPEVLATLEDEELLVRDEEFRGRWRFRHELLREVAYDSLPKRARRRLHERVAEGLDELEAAER